MKRRAFTLVELLIVMGILAVLAGLLLSSGKKAREQANSVLCANNLRQIALGFISYTMDNDEKFPAHAVAGTAIPEDWIYWQESIRDLKKSPILKYLKGAPTAALSCPSDDVRSRTVSYPFIYPHSYAMNMRFSSTIVDPTTGVRLSRSGVKNPSQKILLLEESEQTINDGSWNPLLAGQRTGENYISTRHFAKRRRPEPTGTLLNRPDRSERGMASFADGHAEAISRADTWQPMHYEPRSDASRDRTR